MVRIILNVVLLLVFVHNVCCVGKDKVDERPNIVKKEKVEERPNGVENDKVEDRPNVVVNDKVDEPPNIVNTKKDDRPNIVIFLVDDLGIGDIGCFGNKTLRTPHVDSLCARGAKLSQHLTADALCSPSRSALMTSRLPVRTGFAATQAVGVIPFINSRGGLPANETTFPKLLQKAGYNTALIGKWHLGVSCEEYGDLCHHPNTHGFDYFFGLPLSNTRFLGDDTFHLMDLPPQRRKSVAIIVVIGLLSAAFIYKFVGAKSAGCVVVVTSAFPLGLYFLFCTFYVWNGVVMRNGEIVEQPVNLTNMTPRLVNEGIRYLEKQTPGEPFLLFMSWVQVHTALHAAKQFQGHSAHGPYGDEVEEMDWSVGQVLDALDRFGLMDNTIVYFSSDNGGHFEERHGIHGYRTGGYNGPYRGNKCQGGQEGGIRVPSALMWQGYIPAGVDVSVPTSQMDLFPTLLKAASVPGPSVPGPSDRTLDGVDLLPLLTTAGGEGWGNGGNVTPPPPHKFMFHYCGAYLHAVRYTPGSGDDVYKVYFYMPDWTTDEDSCDYVVCTCPGHHSKLSVPRVINIARDVKEESPLAEDTPRYRDVVRAVDDAVREHEASVLPVPYQMHRNPTPRLQPCCGGLATLCHCSLDQLNALNYVPPWNIK